MDTVATGSATRQSPETEDRTVKSFGVVNYFNCFLGIVWREVLRFLHQRERFLSALVRPLVWLFIFAAGFRQVLGVSIIPPYETYVLYETYVTPGLLGMILLFNAMQSSLSMVYDRETGAMRTLLVSPFPRWFLLSSKLLAGVAVGLLQVVTFLLIAGFWEVHAGGPVLFWVPELNIPLGFATLELGGYDFCLGYLTVIPAIILAGLMLGSLALFMSSVIRQLENFAGVMNFVIFPMFFASSALYPLWKIRESSPLLYEICWLNPFTHAVELIRFAFHAQLNGTSFLVTVGCLAFFLGAAIYAYNPSKGLIARKGGPRGGGPKG